MNFTENTTARAVAAGLVAAIGVLIAGYAAGEGLNVAEWLLALSTLLTVMFGLTAAENRRELKQTKADIDTLNNDHILLAQRVSYSGQVDDISRRLGEVETAVNAMDAVANSGRYANPETHGNAHPDYKLGERDAK